MSLNEETAPMRDVVPLATNQVVAGGTTWLSPATQAASVQYITCQYTVTGSVTPHLTTIQGTMDHQNWYDLVTVVPGVTNTEPVAVQLYGEQEVRAQVANTTSGAAASTVSILLGVQVF